MSKKEGIYIVDSRDFESMQVRNILLSAGYVDGENILDVNDKEDIIKIKEALMPELNGDVRAQDINFENQEYIFTYKGDNLDELLSNLYNTSKAISTSDLEFFIDKGYTADHIQEGLEDYYSNSINQENIDAGYGVYAGFQRSGEDFLLTYETASRLNKVEIERDGEEYNLKYSTISRHSFLDSSIITSAENNGLTFEPTAEQLIKNEIYANLLVSEVINKDEQALEFLSSKLPTYDVVWKEYHDGPTVISSYISDDISCLKNIADLDSQVAAAIKDLAQEKLDDYNNNPPYIPDGAYYFNEELRPDGSFYDGKLQEVKDSLSELIVYCEKVATENINFDFTKSQNSGEQVYAVVPGGICNGSDGLNVLNIETVDYSENGKFISASPMQQISEMVGVELSFEDKCLSAYIEGMKYGNDNGVANVENLCIRESLDEEQTREIIERIQNQFDSFEDMEKGADTGLEL